MIDVPNEVLTFLEGQMTVGFAVFLRMSAFFVLLPGFGEQSIPMRIKLALSVLMTVLLLSAVPAPALLPSPIMLVLTETASGAFFGVLVRLFVMGLQTAGVIAAQATSLSQLLGGSAADPLPAMGHILVISGIALAVLLGLHIKAAQFFLLTYDLVPVGSFLRGETVARWGLSQVGKVFGLAFSLAAPFLLMSVIYNIAIGAINKAMPQLMVAFVGAPLITAGGLVVLFLAAPLMLQVWIGAMDRFLAAPLQDAF